MATDMTSLKGTVELYTQMVAAEAHCIVSDMKSLLWDKVAEITSLRHQADESQSLELKFQMATLALNSGKANLSKEITQLVHKKQELRHKYDNLKYDKCYLEDKVQRLKMAFIIILRIETALAGIMIHYRY